MREGITLLTVEGLRKVEIPEMWNISGLWQDGTPKKRRDLRDFDLYGHKWDSTLQHAEPLDWSYLYCWTPLASKMLRHSRAKDSATEHICMCFSIVQSWWGGPVPHNVEGSNRKATGSHAPQNRACTVYQTTKLEESLEDLLRSHAQSVIHPASSKPLWHPSFQLLSRRGTILKYSFLERIGAHGDTDERLAVSTGKRSQPLQLFHTLATKVDSHWREVF